MLKNIRLYYLVAAMCLAMALATKAHSKPPQTFTGVITRISDGDTYIVKRDGDGSEVKVRLHYADCPEVAHHASEVDQPGGQAALEYAKQYLLDKSVTVTVRGQSYGRIVGDIDYVAGKSLASHVSWAEKIVHDGHAMLDPRYHPPKALVDAQAGAKANHRGLWDCDGEPTPPWTWREQVREKAIASRSK